MIKVLEGNEFLIREYIQDHINQKFKNVDEFELQFSVIKNPLNIQVIIEGSAFALNGKVIIWDFDIFKKFEKFNPYIIPMGVDIFITGNKIDKRLAPYVVRAYELYITGAHTLKQITTILFQEGLRTKTGNKVGKNQEHRFFLNRF